MKSAHIAIAAAALAATAALPTALADEVWATSTGVGNLVYDSEFGQYAVLTLTPTGANNVVTFYIDGLAGNYDDRGVFDGYWVTPTDEVDCGVSIQDPHGKGFSNWGRVKIDFLTPAYPSGLILQAGTCFEALDQVMLGSPLLGDAAEPMADGLDD